MQKIAFTFSTYYSTHSRRCTQGRKPHIGVYWYDKPEIIIWILDNRWHREKSRKLCVFVTFIFASHDFIRSHYICCCFAFKSIRANDEDDDDDDGFNVDDIQRILQITVETTLKID
jgi:hypothetical protein